MHSSLVLPIRKVVDSTIQNLEKRALPYLPWAILCSLLLHVIFFSSRYFDWKIPTIENKEAPLIEITEVPPTYPGAEERQALPVTPPLPVPEKEIAETEDANNRDIDPNAKYLSDRNQKAEKQMRSQTIDDFRAKEGSGKKAEDVPLLSESSSELDVAPDGIAPSKPKKDWKQLTMKDLGIGGDGGDTSASDDRLNGLDRGDRTVLSTREFKFFGYYHRIKELLRQYWKPYVEHQITRVYGRGRAITSDEMITRVVVMLKNDGTLFKISKIATSGIPEIDEAAVLAFERAAPFPHPPKGMIDSDGFVRINWDFILKAETAPRIQFRSSGNAGGGTRERGLD